MSSYFWLIVLATTDPQLLSSSQKKKTRSGGKRLVGIGSALYLCSRSGCLHVVRRRAAPCFSFAPRLDVQRPFVRRPLPQSWLTTSKSIINEPNCQGGAWWAWEGGTPLTLSAMKVISRCWDYLHLLEYLVRACWSSFGLCLRFMHGCSVFVFTNTHEVLKAQD